MDTLADFLTSIRNASRKGLEKADVPFSKIKNGLARILKEEGYIQNFRVLEENQRQLLRIQLKYSDDRKPVIQGIQRISRPGLRVYESWREFKKVGGGMGISILSTSKGLMTHRKARGEKVGGEVLCNVW
ncbi:MAG: 30S ribosomal protein S8 [Elusimicrobia bacterium]|nr:30S ribosomal protein S8 [Elusimicrobiota bacterium]MBI4217721.1 30S ribosomal protein S8 [Elusimicrobiota bacterium]